MNLELKNYIAIVLDQSGSMGVLKKEIVQALNDQITTIKKNSVNQPTRVCLTTFDSYVNKPLLWNERAIKLKPIEEKDYNPTGLTAMRDAVGDTIKKLTEVEDASDPNTSFLVIVVSDGHENASKRYTSAQLASMVKEAQDTGRWTFSYIGANQDLTQVSKDLGISMDNMLSFAPSAAGLDAMSVTNTRALDTYYAARSFGKTQVNNLYAPETEEKDTGTN